MLDPYFFDVITKLVLSTFLGLSIGFERERRGKQAGLRTFTLVSLGATAFTMLSVQGVAGYSNADPTRIAAQVVVGIGFLGGGLIFFKEDFIFGLTTAAGLWVTAAIGMAVGFGAYSIAIIATLLVIMVLAVLRYVERRISRKMWPNE